MFEAILSFHSINGLDLDFSHYFRASSDTWKSARTVKKSFQSIYYRFLAQVKLEMARMRWYILEKKMNSGFSIQFPLIALSLPKIDFLANKIIDFFHLVSEKIQQLFVLNVYCGLWKPPKVWNLYCFSSQKVKILCVEIVESHKSLLKKDFVEKDNKKRWGDFNAS